MHEIANVNVNQVSLEIGVRSAAAGPIPLNQSRLPLNPAVRFNLRPWQDPLDPMDLQIWPRHLVLNLLQDACQ